jgi:hypothetical protein
MTATEPSYAQIVDDTIKHCLYQEHEIPEDGSAPEDAIIVRGLVTDFGLHPSRVEEKKPIVKELIEKIVTDEFLKSKGGGMSFLRLCVDREGGQWAEHRTMEAFCCLAIAMGYAQWCMPRELWAAFPGGMPYVMFDPDA